MKNTKAYGAEIQDELRETAPEYEKWRRRLFIMNCVIATGVFLLEIGVNIILFVQGKVNPDIVYHLMRYLVVPSGLVFLAVLFDGIMMRCFPNKDWLLNYIMVLTVVFMCTVVAVTHYVFPITMTAFVIPVLMSVVFGNNCMTAATAASCSVCVILTGIWRNIDGTDTDRYYVVQEVVISLGIIFVSLIVAGIVNSLISDCCNMAAGRAKAKELELLVECADNVPMKLCGDETHIRQIIMNLLTNAVKYTENGTVKLIVSGSFNDGGFVLKVDVSDTGIGIAEENLPQLFTQFQRFDLQRNRNIEGTGLGLSIVKRLCDLMSGTITARSVLGSGSTFTVELPQKVVDSTPCGGVNLNYSAGAEHEYHHSFEAPEAKILAVDDLPVNLLVIANLLKETRIKIDTAGSGRECLDKCSQQKYDLILMDHMMPEMDGVQTFEKLHGDKSSPNFETPVIMLTANALAGMREQYMDVGFADYVSKPVRGAKLEEAIRRNLPESLTKPASPEIPAEAVSTEPSGFADICGAVPELNVNAALQYCCGSAELLNDLLHDFTENDHFSDLKAAFEEKRWEDYRRHAHSLKSTSLMIGLTGLSERARASELALKGGCTEFAELNHDSLIEEYSALLGKIKDYLKDKSE